jgi:hypothetical protein
VRYTSGSPFCFSCCRYNILTAKHGSQDNLRYVKSEVLTAIIMKITAFWDVIPYTFVDGYQPFPSTFFNVEEQEKSKSLLYTEDVNSRFFRSVGTHLTKLHGDTSQDI